MVIMDRATIDGEQSWQVNNMLMARLDELGKCFDPHCVNSIAVREDRNV
jgi:hypothetical protein